MLNFSQNRNLSNINTSLPNMSNTIVGWFQNISFDIVDRELDGSDWIETGSTTINTRGVVQPPRDEDLKILPEGAWVWEWLLIHCLPDVHLNTNQYIKYDGKLYKVMSKKDWSKYGYVRYTVLEAFRAEDL